MSKKNEIKVEIAGKYYTISGSEDAAYMNRVAVYLNQKLEEIQEVKNFNRMSKQYQDLMIYLNLADDYFKAKNQASNSEEIIRMEEEAYQLKCELVEVQMKYNQLETDTQAQAASLQTELKEKIEAYETADKEKTELKQQLESSQKEAEEKIGNLQKRLQSFQEKFHEIEKEMAQKDEQLEEQKKQLQEQAQSLADVETLVNEKVKDREEECEARCLKRDEAWREALLQQEKEYQGKIVALEKKLSEQGELDSDTEEDAPDIEGSENEVEKLKRMLELSQDEQISMLEEIEEYKEEIQKLQEELEKKN
jgi:cell division protein ZapA